jgi:hypothetical protein
MKFMQRAAASSPSTSSVPSTPESPDPSNKRRKIAHHSSSPQDVNILASQAAVQAAIAEEEKKVERARLKRAEELGDAPWVLDIHEQAKGRAIQTPLNIIQVGFAHIDSSDALENETDPATTSLGGVPTFKRYNMDKKTVRLIYRRPPLRTHSRNSSLLIFTPTQVAKQRHNASSEASSGSESDSDSDTSEEETSGRQSFGSNSRTAPSAQSVARKILKGKKSSEQLKAMQFAEKRRKREVNLNSPKGGMLSISSGGDSSPRQSRPFTCYKCGEPGHKAIECTRPGSRLAR